MLSGSCGGASWSNVFHYLWNAAITGPEQVEDAVGYIGGAFGAQLLPQLSGDVTLTEATGRDLSSADSYFVSAGLSVVGGYDGATLPPGSACVVTWRTALGGRSNRGRTFLIGVPEEVVDASGDLQSTYRGTLQGAVDDFLTDVNGHATGDLAVASKYHMVGTPKVLTPRDPGFATPITSGLVRQYMHSQRRRNLRG